MRRCLLFALSCLLLAAFAQTAEAQKPRRFTLLASAERTATVTTATFNLSMFNYCYIHLDLTEEADTPGLTTRMQVLFPVSADWVTTCEAGEYLPSGAGTETYLCGLSSAYTAAHGVHEHAGLLPLAGVVRFQVAHDDTDAATYSLEAICGRE
jgi:hypothetical protein